MTQRTSGKDAPPPDAQQDPRVAAAAAETREPARAG